MWRKGERSRWNDEHMHGDTTQSFMVIMAIIWDTKYEKKVKEKLIDHGSNGSMVEPNP